MNLFEDIIVIDELIRSRRKTISIVINQDAKVTVRAPLRASMKEINSFIKEKSQWIQKKKLEIQKQINKRERKLYLSGEKFPFLGKNYPLIYINDCKNAIEFDYERFIIDIEYKNEAATLFNKWYKKAARRIIGDKLDSITSENNLEYSNFRINSAKSRWGSCSSRKTLNFTYRLIMLPEFVVDYIIIHELCHTIEMNHSQKFWNLVDEHCPDYKKAENWLKNNSYSIEL